MNEKWNSEHIKHAVITHNNMVEILNTVMPTICGIVDGARVTKDGLDKKTREKIYILLPNNSSMRAHVKSTADSIHIKCDFNSRNGEDTVCYADIADIRIAEQRDDKWHGLAYEPIAKVTVPDVVRMVNECKKADVDYKEARRRLDRAMWAARVWII